MALQEILLTLTNRPGTLAKVARILAQERINVAAISADSTAGKGRVRLVVSDPTRASALLTGAGYDVELREMLAVRLEDRAGSFLRILDALDRARINIQSVAILVAREGNQPLVALSASNLSRARKVLEKAGFAWLGAERIVSIEVLLGAAPSMASESGALEF